MTSAIVLQCDDLSHASKVAKLGVFQRSGDSGEWAAIGHRRPKSGVFVVPGKNTRTRDLVDDQPRTVGDLAAAGLERGDRRRFEAECPLCGLRVVARAERVDQCFDALFAEGLQSISLRALAASLQ